MGLVGSIVVFIITWWLVFFAVLPWGVASQAEHGSVEPGTDPGAPMRPALGRKALLTTAIALGVWLLIYVVVANGLIGLESLRPPS